MQFKTIKDFTDSVDGKVCRNGKSFPHAESEYDLKDDRIVYLMTDSNKHKEPLIAVTDNMTVDELKHIADLLEVDYKATIKKAELLDLLRK
ncbi:MAG: hypothetical protein JJU16_05195 [Alkalibacterium sp.]|nr:hypothetical protein [Alkalibacterium sp.]